MWYIAFKATYLSHFFKIYLFHNVKWTTLSRVKFQMYNTTITRLILKAFKTPSLFISIIGLFPRNMTKIIWQFNIIHIILGRYNNPNFSCLISRKTFFFKKATSLFIYLLFLQLHLVSILPVNCWVSQNGLITNWLEVPISLTKYT